MSSAGRSLLLVTHGDENRIIDTRGLHASDTTLRFLMGRCRRDDQHNCGVGRRWSCCPQSRAGVVMISNRPREEGVDVRAFTSPSRQSTLNECQADLHGSCEPCLASCFSSPDPEKKLLTRISWRLGGSDTGTSSSGCQTSRPAKESTYCVQLCTRLHSD